MKGILESFCPRCGRPSEGICDRCRAAEVVWIRCDPRMESVACPICGAVKQGGAWVASAAEREQLARELALRAVHLHPEVEDVRVSTALQERSQNRTVATTSVSGTLYSVPLSATCRTEIRFRSEQCTRCSRIRGGYYEGVVQVRAKDRAPTGGEVQAAARIACDLERRLQESGERLSFVSEMQELREGLDIVVGTQHLGLLLAQAITAELGGRFTTHPKLVGERDGKALYRITYSIRLPFYQKGDVIEAEGRYYEVREVENQYLRVFDLVSGSARSIPEDQPARRIGNVREARDAIVAYRDGAALGILDPDTYVLHELEPIRWLPLEGGDTVRVLRDRERERLVPVG
ncbi:MAG: 60S ribosomal export protein NMD3 [Methanomicrobiales archaeon]|nr:60S ribosomal export protein NMD3 [Methanomicrobiales archaeon]MDI6877150.1 60S ribosomal export protein NMD3 [Methanomicrobiales archaeon]